MGEGCLRLPRTCQEGLTETGMAANNFGEGGQEFLQAECRCSPGPPLKLPDRRGQYIRLTTKRETSDTGNTVKTYVISFGCP